jgi:hypothetical protein
MAKYKRIGGKTWKNNETPGSGEQYGRGEFTLRNCDDGDWRLFGPGSIDIYGRSPAEAVRRLERLAAVIHEATC